MTLTFPRDLVLEAYLGRWVDITALAESRSLRQADAVVVTTGSSAEQGRVPPSTVEGVLANLGGHWTPGNPMSDYYDYLQGRNVPTRLSLRVSRDAFNETLPSSIGGTDTGESWSHAGLNDSYSVGSGTGKITVSATNSFGMVYIPDSYPDCQTRITSSWNLNVSGGDIEPGNLTLRYQSGGALAGQHYLLRVAVTPAEELTATIFHSTAGALSLPFSFGFITPGGNSIRSLFQAEGQTLRGKIYPAGPPGDPDRFEPRAWQVSCHDERLATGFPGFRLGVATGNTNVPVTVSHDDWELRLVRHTGELTSLQPSWDASHRIKKARIKCADITQRLGRPQRATLSSAPRRYVPTTAPLAYWPCDDAELADAVRPLVGTSPIRMSLLSGSLGANISTAPLAPWLGTGVTTRAGASMICPVDGSPASSWCAELSFLPDQTGTSTVAAPFVVTTDGSIWSVYVDMVASTISMKLNPSGGAQVTLGTTAALSALTTGRSHYLRWVTADAGGSINWFIYLDGTLVMSSNRAAMTNTAMTQIRLYSEGQATVFGHVAAHVGFGPTLADGAAAAVGYAGERALTRVLRLCGEEGMGRLIDYWGPESATRAMGPQHPLPFLDLLQECADADGGVLFAPRYTAGLAWRGRRAMCAQPAAVTLSYAGGHVARELAPSADDRPTANLVRAERKDGGFVIVEQVTGPMNTQDPGTTPDAVGRVPAEATPTPASLESDAQLGDLAGWVRALGTTPELRYPRVTVNMRAPELLVGADPTLIPRALMQLHPVGDRLLVTGLGAADIYRDLDQMVRGMTERFSTVFGHQITMNTAPYEKWRAGVYGASGSRYAGATTTLDAILAAGVTGARNVTVTAGPVWTTAVGAYPLNVVIGGERCTVSGVTGAGAAQVMTISARNLNALPVVGGKTHPAGTAVYLDQPVYYC